MLRRYWLPILAVVGLISAAQAQQPTKAQGASPSAAIANHAPQDKQKPSELLPLQRSIEGVSAAIEAAANKEETPQEKRRAEQDLEAQLIMAIAAKKMFWVGVVEAAITFAGVLLVLATLLYTRDAAKAARDAVDEAKEATKAAREIGESQVRAYLHAKSATVRFLGSVETPYFEVAIVNTGQSPAIGVVAAAQIRFDAGGIIGTSPLPPNWRGALGKAIQAGGEEVLSVDAERIPISDEVAATTRREKFAALISVRVVYLYLDVFKKPWEGDAYFVGFLKYQEPVTEGGLAGLFDSPWKAELRPVLRPQNWADDEA